jgi:hypothetical protein
MGFNDPEEVQFLPSASMLCLPNSPFYPPKDLPRRTVVASPQRKGSDSNKIYQDHKRLTVAKKSSKKRNWKKPKDMPKRPLSVYNLFFAHERKEMLRTGSLQTAASDSDLVGATKNRKIGFAGLARSIAGKWKALQPTIRSQYEEQASKEQERYKRELKVWKQKEQDRKSKDQHQTHAQLAAAGMLQVPSVAYFQAARSISDSLLMGLSDDVSAMSTGLGNQSFPTLPNGNFAQLPGQPSVWPAMPQTIASLGNIYDASTEQERSEARFASLALGLGSSLDPAGAAFMPTARQHPSQLNNSAMSPPRASFAESTKQKESTTSSSTNSLGTLIAQSTTMSYQVNNLTSQLSSPRRINHLASQLDAESFDFLKSLTNGNGSSPDD